jgi:hypothetical protein
MSFLFVVVAVSLMTIRRRSGSVSLLLLVFSCGCLFWFLNEFSVCCGVG